MRGIAELRYSQGTIPAWGLSRARGNVWRGVRHARPHSRIGVSRIFFHCRVGQSGQLPRESGPTS
jgi:hypothetical protein